MFEKEGDCTEQAKLLSMKRRLIQSARPIALASCGTDTLLLYFRHRIAFV
jgi:hypothetical protein